MSLSEKFIEEVLASEVIRDGKYFYEKNIGWTVYNINNGFYTDLPPRAATFLSCKEELVMDYAYKLIDGDIKFSGNSLNRGLRTVFHCPQQVKQGLVRESDFFAAKEVTEFLQSLNTGEEAINSLHEFMGLKNPEISFKMIKVSGGGDDTATMEAVISVRLAPFWFRNPILLYILADHLRTGLNSRGKDLIRNDEFLRLFKGGKEIRKMLPVRNRKKAWESHKIGKGPIFLYSIFYHFHTGTATAAAENYIGQGMVCEDYQMEMEDIKLLLQRFTDLNP